MSIARTAVFVSHANPEDNTFAVWLGAKLAVLGYEVWADVLRLRGGQDWQRRLEREIRERACKVLLVGTRAGADKQGVRNEIHIASEVGRSIGDSEFIVPLRLERFDAPFLVAHAQFIDFMQGWSVGLAELLSVLEETYHVPRTSGETAQWWEIHTVHAGAVTRKHEYLVSNWLTISYLPPRLLYHELRSLSSDDDFALRVTSCPWPLVQFQRGCLSFAGVNELSAHFGSVATVEQLDRLRTDDYLEHGWSARGIDRGTARRHFADIGRQGIENVLHGRGLNAYRLSSGRQTWWPPRSVAPVGKVSFSWSGVSGRRQIQGISAKRGMHWHFGITTDVRVAPIRHVRLMNRVVFTEDGTRPFDDPKRMHRLRRSFAKSWRNPRWRDMMLAFLYWLTEGRNEFLVPMAKNDVMKVRLPPVRFVAPVGVPLKADKNTPESDDDEAAGEIAEGDFEDSEEE